jgi:acetyl-CoA carboxylase biotin carboxyl carrier protein
MSKTPKSSPTGHANPGATTLAGLNVADLDTLAGWLKKSGLEEVEIESGSGPDKVRLRLKKPGGAPLAMAPVAAAAAPSAAPAAAAAPENTFKSPMVGTFYMASGPDAAPFVQVGSVVKIGQPLCIIEAMKTMNQIVADAPGTLQKILGQTASPVEFGQPLFVIS